MKGARLRGLRAQDHSALPILAPPLRLSRLLSGLRAGSGLLLLAGCAFALKTAAAALPAVVGEGAVV